MGAAIREDEDFFSVPLSDPAFATAPVMTHLEPGDLLMWDSRTLHCSQPSLSQPVRLCKDISISASPNDSISYETSCDRSLLRAACFVCMVPRNRASPEVLRQRKIAAQEGITTTHRPHLFQSTLDYDHFHRLQKEG